MLRLDSKQFSHRRKRFQTGCRIFWKAVQLACDIAGSEDLGVSRKYDFVRVVSPF